jgi:acetate---CoA ligase (ADP-forming)
VLSEGFAESGRAGAELQRRLQEVAHRTGIRVMGPNTFGVVNTANGLATLPPFADQERIVRGGIAFCSQTGSIGPHQNPVADWAYPISKMCDVGNKSDVDETDLLNYFAEDPETEVVALHLEDVRDASRFLAAVRRLAARKPLVVLKTGRTEGGARAARSHTGALTVRDRIVESALRQAGAVRVRTWQELWEVPKTFFYQPLPAGNRFAVITFTGGQGVIAADAAADAGLELADFSPDTVRRLSRVSPRLGRNPVDIGPVMSDSRSQSSENPFAVLEQTVPAVLEDENVDCLTLSFYAGTQIVPLYPRIVEMLDRLTRGTSRTVNVWIYGTSTRAMEDLARRIQERRLPACFDLDMAVRALGYAARYARVRKRLEKLAPSGPS